MVLKQFTLLFDSCNDLVSDSSGCLRKARNLLRRQQNYNNKTSEEVTIKANYMTIETIETETGKIAEIISNKTIICNLEDGLDLLGNIYYQGFEKVIIYENNITKEFFNLKSRLAGEVLQKFTTYRVRLVIVGDFSKHKSKSLQDFIYESNQGKQVNFMPSRADAINALK